MDFFGKHSFTLYPSLDPYRQIDRESNYTVCPSQSNRLPPKLGGNWLYIIFQWIVLEAANLVVTHRLFLQTAGDLRFGGNWHHIIFLWIVLDGGSRFGGDGQTIFTDRRLSEIWRELALHYFWAEWVGGSRLGGEGQIMMTFRWLSQIWRELALHYFPAYCFGGSRFGGDGQTIIWTAGYLRFSGNWHHIIFRQIVLGLIFFRLKNFFGAHFRYKLMYYNLYHVSDLCEIVRFYAKLNVSNLNVTNWY